MGMNDNPLYAPSSSRKILKTEDPKNKFIKSKGFMQKNLNKNASFHQKESSNFNSEKIIE
jgi:hypothetical protein